MTQSARSHGQNGLNHRCASVSMNAFGITENLSFGGFAGRDFVPSHVIIPRPVIRALLATQDQ
jgi:hypothetical protein